MVQANELRLGNHVKYDDGTITTIEGIRQHDVYLDGFPQPLSLSVILPIPLTPDVLERCGFEGQDGEFQHPENTDFDLMICCSENGLWCAYNFGQSFDGFAVITPRVNIVPNPICNPFKHLHQLQNLYYCLCGTELNFTL